MLRRRRVSPTVMPYDMVGIGASWGGVEALSLLLSALPSNWTTPIVIVQHQHAYSSNALERILSRLTALVVVDVGDKEDIRPGHVYIAPANYHLLIESDNSFSLSLDAPVSYSRPSIDVTFSSMAQHFGARCLGVLLTGANEDGVIGLGQIHAAGGYTIAQEPSTAIAPIMPAAAIAAGIVDSVLTLNDMVPFFMHRLRNGNK